MNIGRQFSGSTRERSGQCESRLLLPISSVHSWATPTFISPASQPADKTRIQFVAPPPIGREKTTKQIQLPARPPHFPLLFSSSRPHRWAKLCCNKRASERATRPVRSGPVRSRLVSLVGRNLLLERPPSRARSSLVATCCGRSPSARRNLSCRVVSAREEEEEEGDSKIVQFGSNEKLAREREQAREIGREPMESKGGEQNWHKPRTKEEIGSSSSPPATWIYL